VARNSGHDTPWEAPRLFVAAVREVVEAARMHSRLDAARLSELAEEGPAP
jgi:hypothetical protein